MIRAVALVALLGGLGAGGIVTLLVLVFVARAWWTTPFEVLGFGGAPEQPIPFPHTVHAGLGILLDADRQSRDLRRRRDKDRSGLGLHLLPPERGQGRGRLGAAGGAVHFLPQGRAGERGQSTAGPDQPA